jgi:hypothetical protein
MREHHMIHGDARPQQHVGIHGENSASVEITKAATTVAMSARGGESDASRITEQGTPRKYDVDSAPNTSAAHASAFEAQAAAVHAVL